MSDTLDALRQGLKGYPDDKATSTAVPSNAAQDALGAESPDPRAVTISVGQMVIPTYMPAAPDKNPMFLEKRVYQGSNGKVYPLPFTDRICEKPVDRNWKAIWIENEYVRVLVLPELGGRIHAFQDKTNGYDLLYNQPVIKPALVALAGPWISGGIEFNWPQHHRPATFLPVDYSIEDHEDGSKTIWCSDHDPMARMKGMHGICLHPGRTCLELKVRAYNRTPFVQTFLWWANVATQVHEAYQSFFPPDVHYVADHARRSTSAYPRCKGFYYGINYGERTKVGVPPNEVPSQFVPPHCRSGSNGGATPDYAPNDLSFYANIPTPCSYMCMGSKEDFFGGYDFKARAGIVHWANHHISPGKKQWTWGNHEFGYAWDRNLTVADKNGQHPPYIEIMAGVYTDNQPDFSFLQPGETKVWSQYWYPIQEIGPVVKANLEAAISVSLNKGQRTCRVGVGVTREQRGGVISLINKGKVIASFQRDISPASPWLEEFPIKDLESLQVLVTDASGVELISWTATHPTFAEVPPPATEPVAPADVASQDELFLIGLHLQQYRHATRCPTLYWKEALKRDPLDARCNNAMGLWHLRRAEFKTAEGHLTKAIERLTRLNANPYDGEPYYNLGLCLRFLKRHDEAYAAFYKATWNQAWAGASYHALAELDCCREDWTTALDHLGRALRLDADNTRARDLKAIVLRKLGRKEEAAGLLDETLRLDPLDWWARHLRGETLTCDVNTALDLTLDCSRAGLHAEALYLLRQCIQSKQESSFASGSNGSSAHKLPDQNCGTTPLAHYYMAWLCARTGNDKAARQQLRMAASASPDYCFPARLEEIGILEFAMETHPSDGKAPYYLGNLFYDRRRHNEAIQMWQRSARLEPRFAVVWRNLGIGCYNVLHKPARAAAAYNKALAANPRDARLLLERDQLWKRMGQSPAKRLRSLEQNRDLVRQRDDLSVELCSLYNQVGRHEDALALVRSRNFQPWEGGEGGPLGQHVRSHLALGRNALSSGDPGKARDHFEAALHAPLNLGEAKHVLANQSDIHYWLGCAWQELGNREQARQHWLTAARFKGDFQNMSVRTFSEMTFYSALSWKKLGKGALARKLLRELLRYAKKLQHTPAKIEYFATSLPTMLLFEDDLQFRQETTALFLQAQAHLGLGEIKKAKPLLKAVLKRDPSHAMAADLLHEA